MKEHLIPTNVAEKVLTVGPGDYIEYIGGMGYLLNVYYKNFGVFKYLKTHEYKYYKAKLPLIFFFSRKLLRYIYILISDRKIKIIHLHGASYGSFYRKYILFVIGKYLFRKKTVFHVHGSEFAKFYNDSNSFNKKIIRSLIEGTDLVICLSNSWKEFFVDNFKNIRKIEILGNIIIRPDVSVEEIFSHRSETQKITFVFLGFLGNRKGVFDLLESISANKEFLQDKINVLIGGNGEVERLKLFIDNNNLTSFVVFEGWVSGDRKTEMLMSGNVYILPTYNEGLPLSVIEAMSYYLPVISTPVGGIPEIVIDKRNGLLIQPGDKEGIFNAINNFITNPKLAVDMGIESGKIAAEFYPEVIFPKLLALYTALIN